MDEPETPLGLTDPTQLLQLVMDNIPQFIFWKDSASVYLGCNENFARAAGVESPADVVGKTDFELAWKQEEAEFFREVDRRVMDSGVAEHNIVEPQLQADGRQAWLRTNKVPLRDASGTVVGILGTFEDITVERANEERLRHSQRMESVGRLAGGVAHDFNNMLAGILGAAELLQSDVGRTGRGHDLLRIVVRSAQRAADLTGKLLAFSRRGQLERRPTNLHEVVDDAVAILTRSIDRRITIEVERGAERSLVMGDPSELETALINLGINARDAIEGEGRIRIATREVVLDVDDPRCATSSLEPGEYIELEVSDTGSGIPEDVVDRVFEPFFTTKDVGAGTGLGLAAVYGAVNEHGGAVTLEGRPGVGARFSITLPHCELAPVLESSAEPAAVPAPMTRPMRVLVVDDESAIRTVVRHVLEDLGYKVTLARDGREGLEIFSSDPQGFDGVLLDVVMPRMSGHECLRELRALRPDVRVLMSSGFTRDVTIESSGEDAVAGFLKKPYRPAELTEALAKLLHDVE